MIYLLLAVMNIISFTLMGVDKMKAKMGKWRIPERTLFLFTALFGGLGGVLGMQVFRHKTQHKAFVWGFPALLVLQVLILAALLYMGVLHA